MAEAGVSIVDTFGELLNARGLKADDLRQQCTEDVLLRLSSSLNNWEVVSLYLNLSKSEIKSIKINSNNEEERRIKALTKWKQNNGDDATYYNLIEALNDSERDDMVDQALDYLKEIIDQSTKYRVNENIDLNTDDIRLLCGCGKCTLDCFIQNGCPNPIAQQQLPLLNTSTQSLAVVARLTKESMQIATKFSGLFAEIITCLEYRQDITIDILIMYILSRQRFSYLSEPHSTEFQAQIQKATTKREVMWILEGCHITWFNHSLLGSLVKEFEVGVKQYEDYIESHLDPFLDRSLFEIPNKFCDMTEGSNQLFLKIAPTEKLSAKVLIPLKSQIASVLGLSIDTLEFHSYYGSSVELTFGAPYVLFKKLVLKNDKLKLVLRNMESIIPGIKIQEMKCEHKSHPIESLQEVSVVLPHSDVKMTTIDRMFGSLVVKLVRSITTADKRALDMLKEFICELVPQQNLDQAVSFYPMFNASTIYKIDDLNELILLLKDYWSFFNVSLLEKLINKFGGNDAKHALKFYLAKLRQLSLSDAPVLLHQCPKVKGFSSDIFIVTIKPEFFHLSVNNLLLVRDGVARVLCLESFAFLLRRISKFKNQIEFLVTDCGGDILSKLNCLDLSAINEAYIVGIEYQGVKIMSKDTGAGSTSLDSLMEGVTFLGVESAQEHNVDAQQTVSLPAIDQPDDDGTDEAKIPLLTTSNDKENKPVTDANEDEWPLALQVQGIHAHYTYNTASPQIHPVTIAHKGILEVCSECLESSKDESLLSIQCYFPAVHSPLKLSTVAQNIQTGYLVPIRPRPVNDSKKPFELCNRRKCKGEKSCIYAHSEIECNAWNFDLKNIKEKEVDSSSNVKSKIPSSAFEPRFSDVSIQEKEKHGLSTKGRNEWKVNFVKRVSTVLQKEKVTPELTASNYREKFYYLLCFEESERIAALSSKCNGKYSIQCFRKLREKSQYLCRILGMNDDQVQYATQASEKVFFVDAKNQKDLCEGTILHSNYNDLNEHFYVSLAIEDFRYIQAKCRHLGSGWYQVHMEFEVKHSYFDSLHQAVINIPDSMIKKITPSSGTFLRMPLTASPQMYRKCPHINFSLDENKQSKALDAILKCPLDFPIIISGPFGSGKTRVIARAAYEFIQAGLATQTQTRILICAHHSDTVEGYVSKYLLPAFNGVPQVKVVRITRFNNFSHKMSRNVIDRTIHDLKRDVSHGRHINDCALVIITTYMTSLNIAKIFDTCFTHILLDEAAQVREPEVIAPLSLGDHTTKVVIAGDSKQVGPSVVVVGESSREYGLAVSLLERLELKYNQLAGEGGSEYIKYLTANYRCCPEIVMFLSNTIYKYPITCGPEACLERQHPSIRYPLVFYWCDYGQAKSKMLKGIMEFVAEAVSRQAQHYFSKWPREWGSSVKLKDVCIMSPFRAQLNIIEAQLNDLGLGQITFLPSYSIQGHEFQAVILSTFEPLKRDGTSSNPTKSLTNPKIFNTAISRSKSFVVAVGDPFSLLKAEKQFPEHCWKNYLKECLKNDSVFFPEYYTPQMRKESKHELARELDNGHSSLD